MSPIRLDQPAWLDHAWAELGQREIAGPRSNPRIDEYIRRCGHPRLADDATPWCAAFVGACLERAGHRATGSLLARSYLAWGEQAAETDLGAIAVLSRGNDPRFGHVGFVVGTSGDRIVLLGGNQSDAVTVEAFAGDRLLGLRRPVVKAAASPLAPAETAFIWSLARILELEGGFSDDPFDPGGPTNKGITLATYAQRVGAAVDATSYERLKAELRAIPDVLVERIYREQYWAAARCAELAPALAHVHFDAAVNQGVGTAARMLQEALGVEIDGRIGPKTLDAARRLPVAGTLARYGEIRRVRYRSLKHFWRFGRGWLARVDAVLAQARSLLLADAGAIEAQRHLQPRTSSEKELTPMPDSVPVLPTTPGDAKWWGNSMTIWGALVTGVATVAPAVLGVLGLDVPAALIERLGGDVVTVAQAVGGLAGTLMTIAGRARASTPLQRRPVSLRL